MNEELITFSIAIITIFMGFIAGFMDYLWDGIDSASIVFIMTLVVLMIFVAINLQVENS